MRVDYGSTLNFIANLGDLDAPVFIYIGIGRHDFGLLNWYAC